MRVKTIALALGATLVFLPCTALAANSEPVETTPAGPDQAPGAKDNFDPIYNVCRGTNARCYRPWNTRPQNKVLLYTRTAGPRHANLQPALGPGLDPPLSATQNIAQKGIKAWLEAVGVEVHWTEDVTTLAQQLGPSSSYKAVIFLNTSRDTLWAHGTAVAPADAVNTTTNAHLDRGRTALRQFIRAGGGFVGIHNAFGTEYNWPWYEGLLGGTNLHDHGAFQNGMVTIVARDASTAGISDFAFSDEWYNLVPFPTLVKFLATVDEASLATRRTTNPGRGDSHPVAWCQYYDGGRSWVTMDAPTRMAQDSRASGSSRAWSLTEFFLRWETSPSVDESVVSVVTVSFVIRPRLAHSVRTPQFRPPNDLNCRTRATDDMTAKRVAVPVRAGRAAVTYAC
jgi:type 1 glutamine amidotransferase